MKLQLLALASPVLVGALGACAASDAPICAKQPDPAALQPAEQRALSDAKSRYGKRCDDAPRVCNIRLAKNALGQILVTVASIYPDGESGQCLQAPGDQDLAVYSSDGTFIELSLSLSL